MIQENERQYRVIDQMTTMHAALRDHYGRLSLAMNIGLLAGAITLNAFVFASDAVFTTAGVDATVAKNILGIVSLVLLVLTIVELRVNWAGMQREHGNAANALVALKAKYRDVHSQGESSDSVLGELSQEYARVMDGLPPIPDRLHNKLKALHLFKREESEWMSAHPKTPLFVCRLILRWRGLREAISAREKE